MLGQLQSSSQEGAIRIRRNELQSGATDCTADGYVRAARGLWPHKTAEHWAAAAGREPRIGKYWTAGKVSEAAKYAIHHVLITGQRI